MSDRIIAACDGASKGNPGAAGWGYVVADVHEVPQQWESGPLGKATNNVAELTALEQLLKATDPTVPLEVRMDSQYAMNAVTKWLPGWKRNGWKTAAGKPVANQELVRRIDTLLDDRDVDFVYVPAHRADGDLLNALADQAASDAATSQHAAGTSHGHQAPPAPDRPARPVAGTVKRAPGPGARQAASSRRSSPAGATAEALTPPRTPSPRARRDGVTPPADPPRPERNRCGDAPCLARPGRTAGAPAPGAGSSPRGRRVRRATTRRRAEVRDGFDGDVARRPGR